MKLLALFSPLLYVQISPDCLRIRDVGEGKEIAEAPRIAIPAAQGRPAGIVNPFGHPRSLVSDFAAGEQLLRTFFLRLRPKSLLKAAPRVVMHPLGIPAGGYTQIEVRALHEMALGAGASTAVVREGRPLTEQELLAGDFGAGGRILS